MHFLLLLFYTNNKTTVDINNAGLGARQDKDGLRDSSLGRRQALVGWHHAWMVR